MYILIFFFVIVYGLFLYLWNKKVDWRFNKPISLRIKKIHYALIAIVLFDVVLISCTGYHYRGLWTSRVFVMGLLVTGLLVYPFANKEILTKIERIYFAVFGYSPVGLGVFTFIPFLGIVVTGSLILMLFFPADKIFYNDNNVRIQKSCSGFLGMPRLMIIEERQLFERVKYFSNGFYSQRFDSLSIQIDRDSIRIWVLEYEDEVIKEDTILQDGLYFSIENKKQHVVKKQTFELE